MRSVKQEYPNPVLATYTDDYIESCQFYTSFKENEIVVDSEDIIIPIKYTLLCNGLQKLLDEGKAVAVVSIKSSAASFSRLFVFEKNSNTMDIKIPKYSVIKRIEISGSIIANELIERFTCPDEFNELFFQGALFEIRKGDILATEEKRMIYVDDSELEKPISSIFNINRRANEFDGVEPEFDGQKIDIYLNDTLYNLYHEYKDFNNGSLRRYVTGIIVYPVLIEAITRVCGYYHGNEDPLISDKRWFRAIEKKASKYGIDMSSYQDSYTSLADKLLGEISLEALKSFKDTLDGEVNSGETFTIGGVD